MSAEFNVTFEEQSQTFEAEFNDVIRTPPTLQTKNVTYTSNGTNTVEADDGYDGLEKVNVTVAESFQTKDVTITENGETEITPDDGYAGFDTVNVTTNVQQLRYATNITNLFYGLSSEYAPESIELVLDCAKNFSYAFYNTQDNTRLKHIKITGNAQPTTLSYFLRSNWVGRTRSSPLVLELNLDLSKVTDYGFCIYSNGYGGQYLTLVNTLFDFTSVSYSSSTWLRSFIAFIGNITGFKCKPNTLKRSFSNDYTVTSGGVNEFDTAGWIELCNGFCESYSLNFNAHNLTSIFDAIIGTVTLDEGGYHIFTQDDDGDTTLTEFITVTKGWVIT